MSATPTMTPFIFLVATLNSPLADTSLASDFDIALGTAGLSTATARFDKEILAFYSQSERPTLFYSAAYPNPWRLPFFCEMNRKQLTLGIGQPAILLETGSRWLGNGSRRSLLGDPAEQAIAKAKMQGGLSEALAQLKLAGVLKSPVAGASNIPTDVQKAVAAIIFATLDTLDYRKAAFSQISDLAGAFMSIQTNSVEPSGPLQEQKFRNLMSLVDMPYLIAGAEEVASAVSYATSVLKLVDPSTVYEFKLDTAWGKIELSGGKDTTHDGTPLFISVDTGGNDTYINNPTNSTPTNWASVSIDTGGNDKYVSDPALLKTAVAEWPQRSKLRGPCGPGSALFGVSFCIDVSGDDLYRSTRDSVGSATFGVSYHGDYDGKDTYDIYANSLGYGFVGFGVTEDLAGDDRRTGFNQVQGVGLPMGAGLLIDKAGNDTYECNDKVLDFPSSQTADHNHSMSQGAGYGFRADYLTGHSLSGGIGVLLDLAGTDSYSCGVFGQGVGYWEGTGLLWDLAGQDTYSGQWYVQGAAAHFGIGMLEDGEGDDTYTALLNMAQGAGHDFSTGLLLDRGGDDKYSGPNLSLGAGNANGIGVFADLSGADSYKSSGISVGSSAEAQKGSLRERALSLGLFMDLGGTDTFPDFATWAKNSSRTVNWNQKNDRLTESQLGVFMDR